MTKLYNLSAPLHFGNFAGLPVKILYTLFGCASAFFSVTGYALYTLKHRRAAAAHALDSTVRSASTASY